RSGPLRARRRGRRIRGRKIEGRRPGQGQAGGPAGRKGARRRGPQRLHGGVPPGVQGGVARRREMTLSRVPSPQEASPTAHHRRGLGAWRGPITGVLAALVVVLAGLGGYALGHSGRHSKKEAAAAKRAAEQRAYAAGRRKLAARGRSAGIRAARAAATGGRRPRKA